MACVIWIIRNATAMSAKCVSLMSLGGLCAFPKTQKRAIIKGRVPILTIDTIIKNYNMKLLDIFKRKKNAELECL